MLRYSEHRNLARFCGPRNYQRMSDSVRAGFLWAADNDAYSGFDAGRYRRMLDALEGVPGCLFVACPDVVADATATFNLFLKWGKELLVRGFPLGYVAQDGASAADLPWNAISALFIGGSDAYKLGEDAGLLVKEAKERGKWVHMGRVNTWRRIQYAASIGCDSVDGTKYVRWRDWYLVEGLQMTAAPTQGVLA